MTIQDAIKSGKPFKRSYWKIYLEKKDVFIYAEYSCAVVCLDAEEILADDWEIKQ
jgi:hypothetical protein